MEGLVEVLESTSKKRFDPNKYFTKEEQDIVKETFSIFDEVRRMQHAFHSAKIEKSYDGCNMTSPSVLDPLDIFSRFDPSWKNCKSCYISLQSP